MDASETKDKPDSKTGEQTRPGERHTPPPTPEELEALSISLRSHSGLHRSQPHGKMHEIRAPQHGPVVHEKEAQPAEPAGAPEEPRVIEAVEAIQAPAVAETKPESKLPTTPTTVEQGTKAGATVEQGAPTVQVASSEVAAATTTPGPGGQPERKGTPDLSMYIIHAPEDSEKPDKTRQNELVHVLGKYSKENERITDPVDGILTAKKLDDDAQEEGKLGMALNRWDVGQKEQEGLTEVRT